MTDEPIRPAPGRPTTMPFPVPPAPDDALHVYVSVGHQQMMTDAMTPLGLSVWQLTTPAPMAEAGGRLFVDVTSRLATPSGRAALLGAFGRSDPLLRDALETVVGRGLVPLLADDPAGAVMAGAVPAGATAPLEPDPRIVAELMALTKASIAACAREIRTRTGSAVFEFVLDDIHELRRLLFDPRSHLVFMAAIDATSWLNEHLESWLGETNVADVLTQSVADNVTSEMGLALLGVADVIRPHADVVTFLQSVADDEFLDGLEPLVGGPEARIAIEGFLDTYGMRCVGEIDITRPRWRERPATLVPMILAHVRNMAPGEASRRFERGRQEAVATAGSVVERLRSLPDGDQKAAEAERQIELVRTFIGFREYPKYGMVCRYFLYKQALLAEAERLVEAGVLREPEDAFFLRFQEFHDAVRTQRVDLQLVEQRKADFDSFGPLSAPRVLTSNGEAFDGLYRRDDVPHGALPGLAVSAGTVEGRARVVLDIADADLEPGDILVTAFTDPSWTPLFVEIAGLVTEVGGMMTHGAVIAREYGLPAVVAVEGATRRIADGQRIRLDGTAGFVVVLDAGEPPTT